MTPRIDERTALIVVDMQEGFLRDDSAMARLGFDVALLREAIVPCTRVVAAVRRSRALIVYTRYVFAPDHSDGGMMVRLLPGLREQGALRAGGREVELIAELAPEAGEMVIDKNRPSAFWGTPLDAVLTQRGIERVVVCGITTNCCVESTVRDASHRDLETWLVVDAVAESARDRHDHAVQAMTLLFAYATNVAQIEALQE